MNAFEKYVANEMIANADKLYGREYGDEAEAFFGADMDAGFYMNDSMSNEFFEKYFNDILACIHRFNIRDEEGKEARLIMNCIYTVANRICESLGTDMFFGEKYQTVVDVEFFIECLKKYMEEN